MTGMTPLKQTINNEETTHKWKRELLLAIK